MANRNVAHTPPETKRAYLVNARGEWTPHVYSRSRWTLNTSGAPDGIEHLFRCEHTDAERRWGLEALAAKPQKAIAK
jgi:hypothetical protein